MEWVNKRRRSVDQGKGDMKVLEMRPAGAVRGPTVDPVAVSHPEDPYNSNLIGKKKQKKKDPFKKFLMTSCLNPDPNPKGSFQKIPHS